MKPIPWRRVENWFCIACGDCCKEFKVPLSAYEATRLASIFGYEYLELGLRGYYLKKRQDKRCVFQVYSNGRWICGIQGLKPLACRLWPFIISERPRYDYKDEAEFEFRGQRFYVYLNPYCRGIIYGKPSSMFINKVIPEFIEISLGLRRNQEFSTSMLVGAQLSLTSFMHLKAKGYEAQLSSIGRAIIESLMPTMRLSSKQVGSLSISLSNLLPLKRLGSNMSLIDI